MTELLGKPGNPSSLHASGRKARRLVEESRERVAKALGCGSAEVVFTAGGTEANNIGIKGIAWDQRKKDPRRTRIVTSAIEHHAVMDPFRWLGESEGFEVTWVKPDSFGQITPAALRSALGDDPTDVGLVSIILANNEVGTINDIAALTEVTREFEIRFHTDAVQAPAWLEVNFAELGVCAMSVSGHKVGGPHGIGALVISRDCHVTPLIHGGGQERDVRSGTLDAPAIVAFATALEITSARKTQTVATVSALRDDLVRRVKVIAPDAIYNGSITDRLANNAHFVFPGCLGDSLLMLLDAQGVECSVGSACSAGVPQPSHVLLAMGADEDAARSTLRFTLGPNSTKEDVDALIHALPSAIERAKRAGVPKITTAPVRV
jgi:cysteine desulfurase